MAQKLADTNAYRNYKAGKNERWRGFPDKPITLDVPKKKMLAGNQGCLRSSEAEFHIDPNCLVTHDSSVEFKSQPDEFLLDTLHHYGVITLSQSERYVWHECTALGADHFRLRVPSGKHIVLEHHIRAGQGIRCLDIEIMSGASLHHVIIKDQGKDSATFLHDRVHVASDANYTALFANKVEGAGRHMMQVELCGESASADISGVSCLECSGLLHHHIDICHQSVSTTSKQRVLSVLDGNSDYRMWSHVDVAQHAHNSLSRQKIDHLLLSKDAFAFSKPSLDIATESVDAQHGATTGWLDPSQIFYMQSRGISDARAKKLYIASKINATMKDAGAFRQLLLEHLGVKDVI